MKKHRNTLLLITLLACSYSHANNEPGLIEYQAAIEIREKISLLLEQSNETSSDGETSNEAETIYPSLLEYAPQYVEQLKASSDLGFPPAEFLYAQTFEYRAASTAEDRAFNKKKACKLLDQAAAHGLLAASVGKISYCSTVIEGGDFTAMIKAVDEAHRQLAEALKKPDGYALYYPLKAFVFPSCFERAVPISDMNALNHMSPLQRIQALSPPSMTLEDTQAQAYFLLAIHEQLSNQSITEEHIVQAENLGCSSALFLAIQDSLRKQKPSR